MDFNFSRAEKLIRAAVEQDGPDTVVLPELWSTGFFPKELAPCADQAGERTQSVFSALAKELDVNIVCGSVVTKRAEGFFNTAYVFERTGAVVAEYDKTHLFTLRRTRVFPGWLPHLPVCVGREEVRYYHLL